MAILQSIVVNAVRSVIQRQQLLTANLTGNAFLGFVLYALFVINVESVGVVDTLLVLIPTAFFLCWLHATTFAAFYPGQSEIPFFPALRRLHYFAPWGLAIAGAIALFSWLSSILGIWVWIVGVAAVFALLPLMAQSAGGWYPRSVAVDMVFALNYWVLATVMLILGLYVPFLVFFSLPMAESVVIQMAVNAIRIGVSYLLAISAWVALAAIIGELAARASVPEQFQGEDVARLSESVSDEVQTVTPKRSFSRNAITIEKTTNHNSQ